MAAAIRTVFAQENQDAARAQWRQVADGLRQRFDRLAKAMDSAKDDVLAYMTFHPDHWTKISSTNPLERLNGEIKRLNGAPTWSGSAGPAPASLPNEAAIIRLVGALMLEQNDEWAVGRRYMSLETLAPFGHSDPVRLPAVAA